MVALVGILWCVVSFLPRRSRGLKRPLTLAIRGGGEVIDPRGTPLLRKAARPFVALAKKYDAAIEANPNLELYVQVGGSLVALQLIRNYVAAHGQKQRVVVGARVAYVAFLALHQWALLAARDRVLADDDATQMTLPANPMVEALAKARGAGDANSNADAAPPKTVTTVRDYDLEVINKARHAETGAVLVMAYLHLRRGYLQPLVVSTVMGLASLLKNPIVQVHLFGRDPVGPLARPFKPPVPAWLKALEPTFGKKQEAADAAIEPAPAKEEEEEEDADDDDDVPGDGDDDDDDEEDDEDDEEEEEES